MRFAENILGAKRPYNSWNQMQFRRWLNDGEVISPADGEKVNLYGKIAVLINGQCTTPSSQEVISAPSQLDVAEANFQGNAKVFIRQA